MRLSVPGKTFLVGEYLALEGGPSIVLATNPRFELSVCLQDQRMTVAPPLANEAHLPEVPESRSPFALGSPAGKFFSQYHDEFRNYEITFSDPHNGQGGLGASSAQFALLYALRCIWAGRGYELIREKIDWKKLLTEYRQCAWNGEGFAPSGVDVVGQLSGGVTLFDGREYQARSLDWNFEGLSFTLIRTGKKLATHEHLKVKKEAPLEALRKSVSLATHAFESGGRDELIQAVQDTAGALAQSGLTAEHTSRLLDTLQSERELALAAKGCGAMGADVILVLHESSRASEMESWCRARGLDVCGTDRTLAMGFEFDPEGDIERK